MLSWAGLGRCEARCPVLRRGESGPRVGRRRPREQFWVDDLGKNLQAVNGPWPRAAEVCGAFDRIHSPELHRGEVLPRRGQLHCAELFDGALQTKAAGHQDHDIRVVSGNLLPGDLYGRYPLPAHLVTTARQADHFGYPVARGIGRVEPFHGEDARADRGSLSDGRGSIDSLAKGPRQQGRSLVNASGVPHLLDDLQNSSEIVGLKGEDRSFPRKGELKAMDRPCDLFIRDGTDLAQLLSEDEVRVKALQERLVQRVDTAAAMRRFGHMIVDIPTPERGMVHRAARDNRNRARALRHITFVRDGNQLVLEPEGEDYLGRTGQE